MCLSLGIEDSLLDGCIYDIAVTNDTSFGEQESLKTGKNTILNNIPIKHACAHHVLKVAYLNIWPFSN